MDIKKMVPWNWFQKEEEGGGTMLPVQRGGGGGRGGRYRGWESHPLLSLHREMDRLFADAFRGFPFGFKGKEFTSALAGMLKPRVDIGADEKSYTISVEVPGVDERDLQVELGDDSMVISGEKKQEKEEKEKDYYRMERSFGSFRRVLALPDDADQEGVKAEFRKGVLTITMPRKEQARKSSRQIEVKTP